VVVALKGTPFVIPPDQVYEFAPDPLRVTVDPAQTVEEGRAVDPTVGIWFTVMVAVVLFVHPFAPVPVTV
jgi:hypothetical protein